MNFPLRSRVPTTECAVAKHPPLAECSDEQLLSMFCQGRREAFTVLLRRYEGELYGYLRRYLGDGELAEDVFGARFLPRLRARRRRFVRSGDGGRPTDEDRDEQEMRQAASAGPSHVK